MQPSVMGASASSSVRAIVDIAENYSFSPLVGRGKALRQRRFRDALEVSHRGSPSDRNEAPALPIRSIRSSSSRVERPSRSSLFTTTMSPGLRVAIITRARRDGRGVQVLYRDDGVHALRLTTRAARASMTSRMTLRTASLSTATGTVARTPRLRRGCCNGGDP
jgi:hypothetical protein